MRSVADAWNGFWFRRSPTETLGLMRILVGSMLVYTHLVWTSGLSSFLSDDGMLPDSFRSLSYGGSTTAWSHFDWLSSSGMVTVCHWLAILIFVLFTLGVWTRITSVIAWLLVVSYANRATGSLFGLDQINAFLTLYLAIGNSGGSFSIDRLLKNRKQSGSAFAINKNDGDVLTHIATRLIQVHLCIVYMFAGFGKLLGNTWWNGEAIWGALASYEYQTLDMTWLAGHMWLVNLMTLVAVTWEVFYPFLIWPRLTRPVFLALALAIHLGIGIAMGMMTFGLLMIYANIAFIDPQSVRSWLPGRSS